MEHNAPEKNFARGLSSENEKTKERVGVITASALMSQERLEFYDINSCINSHRTIAAIVRRLPRLKIQGGVSAHAQR